MKRIGKYTIMLQNQPKIIASAAIVGKKEAEGPLSEDFDQTFSDSKLGEDSWEKAETSFLKKVVELAIKKANKEPQDVDMILAGDLMNQCTTSSFGLRELNIPFLGQYGACSTMAQTLMMAAIMVDSGAASTAAAATASHFCSAERQFRLPLEYGGQRTPTAQWTVSGAGCAVVGDEGSIKIVDVMPGKIVDLGIKDAANMGAAMAPAAATTLFEYFQDTGTSPQDYDKIFTGDLGMVGSDLLRKLLLENNIDLGTVHNDCGLMIFDCDKQDVHAGGSGCGCAGSVLCGHILNNMASGKYRNVLFMATGALMSLTSSQQGESIPGIAHLVHLSSNS